MNATPPAAPDAGSDAPTRTSPSTSASTTYRTISVDGLDVFYREAGPRDAPTLLLLHGFPSSSRMFETLIPLLADRYHLVAPDFPGFGRSEAPPASARPHTFDRLAEVVGALTERLGLSRYALYLQDYGGPVGFRLALANPERVQALIVQNAVHDEAGLGPKWGAIRAFWADRRAHERDVVGAFTSLAAAKARHVGPSPHPERYDPNVWLDEAAHLSRPGQFDVQADLLFDYRTNVARYPLWQAWLRDRRPPTLVVWGRYDQAFTVAGAEAFARDVPDAEVHLLDAGHFALDEKVDEVAAVIRDFLARNVSR